MPDTKSKKDKTKEIPLKCYKCPHDGSDYYHGVHICVARKCDREDVFDTQEDKKK